jgi:hypothetical protein
MSAIATKPKARRDHSRRRDGAARDSLVPLNARQAALLAAYHGGYTVKADLAFGRVLHVILSDSTEAVLKKRLTRAEVDRELLANRVLHALGGNVTMIQVSARAIVYEYIHGRHGYDVTRPSQYGNAEGSRAIALLDWLIGNTDRHSGNWILTSDNRVVPIDQDFAEFRPYRRDRFHPVISPFAVHWLDWNGWNDRPFGEVKLTLQELSSVRRRIMAIRPVFAHRPKWLAAILQRLDYLEQHVASS